MTLYHLLKRGVIGIFLLYCSLGFDKTSYNILELLYKVATKLPSFKNAPIFLSKIRKAYCFFFLFFWHKCVRMCVRMCACATVFNVGNNF